MFLSKVTVTTINTDSIIINDPVIYETALVFIIVMHKPYNIFKEGLVKDLTIMNLKHVFKSFQKNE